MSLFTATTKLDAASLAALGQLTQAISLLTTAIKQTGNAMTTALEDLQSVLADVKTAAAAVIDASQKEAAAIKDLADKLAAAHVADDSAAIEAVVAELKDTATNLTTAAATAQAAIPAA